MNPAHVTCTENLAQFGRVIFEIMGADRQTDIHT